MTDGRTGGRADGRTVKRGRATWFGVLAVVFLSVGPSDRLTVLLAQEPAPAPAQAPTGPQVIDRIVAIVGDKAILLSEVDEKIAQARSQGLQIPSDSAQLLQLRRQMLSNMIDEEVIYQQARRDTSVTVTDAEVQTAIDAQMTSVRGQF